MWGLPLLWWARFGKLLQFVGGIVVVLDLIGPRRLRELGARVKRLRQRIKHTEPGLLMAAPDPEDPDTHVIRWWTFIPAGLIALIPAILIIKHKGILWIPVAAFGWVFGTFTGVLLLMLVFLLVSQFVLLLAQLVFSVLATILLGDRPGHPARWASFVLVVVGFHLDLLGGS